jgi:hypothetical protein
MVPLGPSVGFTKFEGFYPVGNVPVTFKEVVGSQFNCGVVVNKFGFPL